MGIKNDSLRIGASKRDIVAVGRFSVFLAAIVAIARVLRVPIGFGMLTLVGWETDSIISVIQHYRFPID